MKHTEIGGIISPIVTPMNADESVNAAALREQVDRQIEGGVHAIFCFGTNGEGYILDAAEKQAVLETVLDQAAGRVPVHAGTGCVGTRESIAQSRMARDAGADALSLITPSFAAASQEELYTHFRAVAEAVELPIILYNIPARTGNALVPATVARLMELPNIVGIKDSSGDFVNLLNYLAATGGRESFRVLSGNDQLILWTLQAGGSGGVAGCANVYPHTMASIYNCFLAGDWEGARRHQESIASFRACFRYGNPNTVVKTAVRLLGYDVGLCRAPFNQLPEEGIRELEQVLRDNAAKGMH